MLSWFPPDRYQMGLIRKYAGFGGIAFLAVLLLGNIITAIVRDRVSVPRSSYVMKEGFPLMTSGAVYAKMVRTYPHNPGVKLTVHTMREGESYWDVAMSHNVSIDTIIGANPHITNLAARAGTEVVVPAENGLLLAIDDCLDVRRMKKLLGFTGEARGEYLPGFFRIISTDDIRLVFLNKARPIVVNDSLERLYRFKVAFNRPLDGRLVSLYGDRVDPFDHGLMEFHNGLDIIGRMWEPLKPAREGMVIHTGWRAGYGQTIIIQHDEGYTTLYGHCVSIKVKLGDWVTKDKVIGFVGSTGRSTGPHLHFMVMRHGIELNPLLFMW